MEYATIVKIKRQAACQVWRLPQTGRSVRGRGHRGDKVG